MNRSGISRSAPPVRRTEIARSPFRTPPAPSQIPHLTGVDLRPVSPPPRPRRDTGFTAAVKLAVRKRAGDGDAGRALCECCGTWLGQYGGDIQHVIARGMGGTSRPEIDSVINAALLCRRDHDTAEARDPELYDRGFWRYSWEEVGAAPLELHGRDGGFTRYLTADGGYSTTPPGRAS